MRRLVALIIVVLLGTSVGWVARDWIAKDKCLDAGGAWKPGGICAGLDPNPLTIAESYARAHYSRLVPKGISRAWHVEDHGDIWMVEIFEQNAAGGGVRMIIAKRDGRVLGSSLTQ
jgi:hypothetical protein